MFGVASLPHGPTHTCQIKGGHSRSGPGPANPILSVPSPTLARPQPHLQLPGIKAFIYVCFTTVLRHSLGTEGQNRFKAEGTDRYTVLIINTPTHRHAYQSLGTRHSRWLAPRALRTIQTGQGSN